MILMSVNKSINVTHFGFGEFAILTSIQSESEILRLIKKILLKVSSNAYTAKLGPVTLCAGISIYGKNNKLTGVRNWINQARQACMLAKTNGRGRVSFYVTPEKRKNLAVQLMLEIKKPKGVLYIFMFIFYILSIDYICCVCWKLLSLKCVNAV